MDYITTGPSGFDPTALYFALLRAKQGATSPSTQGTCASPPSQQGSDLSKGSRSASSGSMSAASSSSASESNFESEVETENFVRVTLDWLAIGRNKTSLRKAIINAIHTTSRFDDDTDDGGEDDLDGATEMDSPESGLDPKATSKQWDFPDIDALPMEILNDPRNGYLVEFRMTMDVYQEIARNIQARYKDFVVFHEFDSGYLRIRTVPAQPHEIVIDALRELFFEFCNSSTPGAQAKPMQGLGSPGIFTDRVIRSAANDQDYNWGVRRGSRGTKRPDASFKPRRLTVPPAKNQVRMALNRMYPTIVFEVAHKNESYRRLVTDARRKAFAGSTSIHVLLGVKIYERHFQCFWAKRHRSGQGMSIMQRTDKLPLRTPTQITFSIPQQDIWWGVAAQAIPLTTTPNYALSLDWLRQRINEAI